MVFTQCLQYVRLCMYPDDPENMFALTLECLNASTHYSPAKVSTEHTGPCICHSGFVPVWDVRCQRYSTTVHCILNSQNSCAGVKGITCTYSQLTIIDERSLYFRIMHYLLIKYISEQEVNMGEALIHENLDQTPIHIT